MIFLITKKHINEFLKNKANKVYIAIMLCICGIIIPGFYIGNFYIVVPTLIFAFISQLAPAVFAGEKENRTLETLISLPIKVNQIYLGKTLYCFFVCVIILYSSFLLGGILNVIMRMAVDDFFLPFSMVTYLFLVPVSIWNLSYHAVYVSLKSSDARVCALSLTFLGVAYSIPPIATFAVVSYNIYNYIIVILFLLYIVIQIIIFMILKWIVAKKLNRPQMLNLLKK